MANMACEECEPGELLLTIVLSKLRALGHM